MEERFFVTRMLFYVKTLSANTDITKELNITPVFDKIQDNKKKWI
jgi:hypothetical protein